MSISPGLAIFKLAFQLSPIILTNGIAQNIPGQMLPIISITEALNFTLGLLSGGDNIDLDNFFANFQPLPGSALINNQIGTYPFANQTVAANAIIAQPLNISLLMMVPVRQPGGFTSKLATMMTLQKTLAQHNNSGGTYTIATPSYFYTGCLMTAMRDVSSSASKQAQAAWQLDFVQPLLSLDQAQQAQNAAMSKISSGVPTDGNLSGLGQSVGLSPIPGPTASVSPAATSLPGAAVAGSLPPS